MAAQTQPNQIHSNATFAAGVLTFTTDIFMNPAVAASLNDGSNTATVACDGTTVSGKLKITVVITPNSAIASANTPILQGIHNVNSPSA